MHIFVDKYQILCYHIDVKVKFTINRRLLYMKSTGIVRPIDTLGRFVLPKEIRDTFDISPKDPIEIFIDGELIILKKYQPSCLFCQNADDLAYFKGKLICPDCLKSLKAID